ncbi:hypothetical protein LTR67_002215 [Exophiala xenobiotica]
MDLTRQSRVVILQHTITNIINHPLLSILGVFISICIITRIRSGIRFQSTISKGRRPNPAGDTIQQPPIPPYWIPWLGHGANFALGGTDYLTRTARSLGAHGSIYTLWMGNSKHHMVTVPGIERQLISKNAPVTMEPFIHHVMQNFWDDRGATRATDPKPLWGSIHGALSDMLRENFVASAIKDTVKALEHQTWNLVSGARSEVDQAIWEREADVRIVSSQDSDNDGDGWNSFVAEAELFQLVRYFVGNIATTVLMGHDFMNNFPNIMHELWEMDTRFNLFVAGTPRWFPGMIRPAAARERVIAAIGEHHDALFKYLDGEDPGPNWSDMSDVASVIVTRAVEFRKAGASRRGWSTGNGSVMWAMNINSNPVVFWLIWYVFSDACLLEELRREMAPYVRFRPAEDNGLPIKEAPRLEIDLASLWAKCPLLKGAFFETMRIEAASMSYKQLEDDFVVTETDEDAKLLGKSQPQSFLLRKGDYVAVPHGVHQSDEKYFRDPMRFDARRFWIKEEGDEESASGQDDPGAARVDYGSMRVWGGGKNMCKGKTFAEREVILFAAAIIMQWDMEPFENAGKWVHPGRKIGAGAVNPVKPVRVRMKRREAW